MVMESVARSETEAGAQPFDIHTNHEANKRSERVVYGAFFRLIMGLSTTRCELVLTWIYLDLYNAKHLRACTKEPAVFSCNLGMNYGVWLALVGAHSAYPFTQSDLGERRPVI